MTRVLDKRLPRPLGMTTLPSVPDFMRTGNVDGACGTADPEWFWPVSRDNVRDIGRAKAVCSRCPLQPDCAEYGIEHEAWGIWGGLTEDERRLIRKERAR